VIVDTHVHIWNAETPETPWRDGFRAYAPAPSFGARDLLREMDAVGVDRAVVIPPEWDARGNETVLAAAAVHPDRLTAYPVLSLRRPGGEAVLREWAARPGFGGVRQMLLAGPSYDPLRDGTADWLWPVAEDLGLTVMLWLPGQLPRLLPVLDRHPGIRFVIDHVNLPMRPSTAQIEEAVTDLVDQAARPNLAVKVSALPAAAADAHPYRSLHPSIRDLVRAFGADRLFWGSDFTRLPCTYGEALSMMRTVEDCPGIDELLGPSFTRWTDRKPDEKGRTGGREDSHIRA
jgi:predicted TIM-barrel fold metal-dependent hydrolase